ncbi:serine/threonine-protein kinase [Sorangium sp. So ce131]|uniref:serine/threonine-protein kinase n=1 Tax=Sorangium sp. So ce131 TaxID=3133282 RepID=UPI003F5DD2F6
MALHTGQMVTPSLRLVSVLRRGGMGSIWVADRLPLRARVAVKFMSPEFAADAGYVERFRREAVAAAQLSSPHVARVLEHGLTADGTPYIAMELLRGEDLRASIRRQGKLPLDEVARIVSQTAKALGQAHRMGIVHRDIKPDNLFLTKVDGETFVKVLDFGIARRARDLRVTSPDNVVGTPLYMSPEQLISSRDADFRADLWSLGIVAYHAITGRVPFTGETLAALTLSVHAGNYPPPSALRPDVPPAVDDWMKRALQSDPDARFGSAKEMADALERAIATREPAVEAPALARVAAAASGVVAAVSDAVGASLVQTRPAGPQGGAAHDGRPPAPAGAPSALVGTPRCDDEVERTTTVMTTPCSRKGRRRATPARLATVAACVALLVGSGMFMALRQVAPVADGTALAAAPRRDESSPDVGSATLVAHVAAPATLLPSPEPAQPVQVTPAQPAPESKPARPTQKSRWKRPVRQKTAPTPPRRPPYRGASKPRYDIALHR